MRKLFGVLVVGLLIVSVIVAGVGGGRGSSGRSLSLGGKVGVIHIQGVISATGGDGGLLGGSSSGIETVLSLLDKAEKSPSIKAVVLRMNSPGGTAAASQEVASAVYRVKKAGKKVVVSMGDVAASGAYWVAADSDRIFANPATMTGSIGVLMETVQLTGLYDKIGISKDTLKSGPYKDIGSESRAMTPQERAILQGMVNDIYEQFVDRVAQGRKMKREEVRRLADGRVFTGRQGKEVGLVDELGDFHDAIQYAGKAAGIKGEPDVEDLGPNDVWETLLKNVSGRSFGSLEKLPVWLLCSPVAQR